MSAYTLEKAETMDYIDAKVTEIETLAENIRYIATSLREFVADDPASREQASRLIYWATGTKDLALEIAGTYCRNI